VFVRFVEGKVYFNIHVFVLIHLVSPRPVCVLFVLPSPLMNMYFHPQFRLTGTVPNRTVPGRPTMLLSLFSNQTPGFEETTDLIDSVAYTHPHAVRALFMSRCSIPRPAPATATSAISTSNRAIALQAASKSAAFTPGNFVRVCVTTSESSRVVVE
jgi:hypothetical protein